jgi:putative transposase
MATTDDLFDNLMNNCKKPGDLVGENSLLSQLFRTTLQSAKQSGMTEHPNKNSGMVANHLQDKT